MSFYDSASLVFLPSGGAGKDGKAYSIKPVPEYGNELVNNQFDTTWVTVSASITSGQSGYDGSSNAWLLSKSGASGRIYQNVSASGVQTFSVYAKANTSTWGLLQCIGGSNPYAYFNLGTGVVGSIGSGAISNSIEDVGGGWYKISLIHNTTITSARIYPAETNTASGTSGSIYIQDASLKEVIVDGDFDFSRGSNLTSTRVDSNGLIEKGRENLLTYSNDFSQWSAGAHTRTAGYSGYDGSNDAWLVEKTTTTNSYIFSPTISVSGVWTYSVYAKADSLGGLVFYTTASGTATFNIEDGLVVTGSNASIESVGNGWYRCSQFGVGSITQTRLKVTDKTGADVQGTIYLQDAQLEIGLVATEYIESGASTGKAGILEHSPRFDYSGGASCPSLLLEPSRTNLVEYSEYFGSWFSSGGTLTANAAISPEGVQNAYSYTNSAFTTLRDSVTLSTSTQYTFSFYAKNVDATNARYRVYDDTNATDIISATSYFSQLSTNEWKRIEVTFTTSATSTAYGVYLESGNQEGTILFYGAQVEEGSYPTSYIPNHSGGSVTRNADVCATLDLSSAGVDGEDVTYFLEFKNNQDLVRDSVATSLRFSSNTSNLGSFRIYRASSSVKKLTIVFQDNGSNFVPSGYEMTSDNPKVVIKRIWATGQIKVFVDGTEVIDGTNTDMNAWYKIDMGGEGSILEVKQLIAFPSALSNTDCEILTGTSYESFTAMATALNYTTYE